MGDPDTPKLLHSIRELPKDAQTISQETGVPLSSVYRKLATLRNVGLAFVKSFKITPEGKRQDMYISGVIEVRIGMGGAQIEVELFPTHENAERIWFELFKS
jgi:hypothetical protein